MTPSAPVLGRSSASSTTTRSTGRRRWTATSAPPTGRCGCTGCRPTLRSSTPTSGCGKTSRPTGWLPRAPAKSSCQPEGDQQQQCCPGVLSQAGGDIRVADQSQGVDRQGAQAGEVGRGGAGADLAVVLAEGHVPHPVQTRLDGPMAADPAGQPCRIGGPGIQAGDGVDGLHAPPAVPVPPPADDLDRLAGVGKELAVPVAAAGQVYHRRWCGSPAGRGRPSGPGRPRAPGPRAVPSAGCAGSSGCL